MVAVFIGMLALANGFRAALVRTGSPENVLILRKGADSRAVERHRPRRRSASSTSSPHVATGGDGRPLVSPEAYIVIPLPRQGGDTTATRQRGGARREPSGLVGARATSRSSPGDGFASGQSPRSASARSWPGRFDHTGIGETLRFAGRDWTVVCRFTAGGSAFESEIWGENEQVLPVFRGETFQSLTFRLKDPGAFEEAKRALEADKRIPVDVHRESEFYAEQSELLGTILRLLAIMITGIMAVGAVFGAVNTMYAAVASRTPGDRRAAHARLPARGACWRASSPSRR